MILKYSPKGIPYIEMDEHTRVIFVKTWPGENGYKWLAVKAHITFNGTIGKKRKKQVSSTEMHNFMTDMKLRKFPRNFCKKHPVFNRIKHGMLKKMFKTFGIPDKEEPDMLRIPDEHIKFIEMEINRLYGEEDGDE